MAFMQTYQSPLGILTMTADDRGITGIYLRPPTAKELEMEQSNEPFSTLVRWLDAYFLGNEPDPAAVRLSLEGTPFRLLIWNLLTQIPYGQTRTYGQLSQQAAKILGKEKMSAQAVGGAVGHNPVSILIPCHRVVAAGNQLGGFGWGSEAKIWLLKHEGGYYDHQ